MKKIQFIDLVLSHLVSLGVTETEIEKQSKQIDSYLTGLGIGDESEELDYESPQNFAEEIFKVISSRRLDETKKSDAVSAENEEDVKVFLPEKKKKVEDEPLSENKNEGFFEFENASDSDEKETESEFYNDLGAELESELAGYYDNEPEEDATREFSIKESDLNDYYADDDMSDDAVEEEEYILLGNPIFFWIITVVLSPVFIPLGILALALCASLFILLSIFIVAYIPLLIALILVGSGAIIAEIIFSVVKFIGGAVHIGFFELGIAFLIVALVICLSVLIYRFGTKYAVKIWRNYPKGVFVIFKKVKRLIRKFKGVCSI